MSENSILDNIEIHKDFAIISVNPKLYPLSVIYSAAYWLLDRVHIIVDGDPETEILIEIRPKKDEELDLKEIGYEFNDELINYSVYTVQATRNQKLRERIIDNALANIEPVKTGNMNQGNVRCDVPNQNQAPDPTRFNRPNDEQDISRVASYRNRREDFLKQ